jgi:hypothetical protein
LPFQERCLWVFSLAAKLESGEILEPNTLRHVGFGFDPEADLMEILEVDIAVCGSPAAGNFSAS